MKPGDIKQVKTIPLSEVHRIRSWWWYCFVCFLYNTTQILKIETHSLSFRLSSSRSLVSSISYYSHTLNTPPHRYTNDALHHSHTLRCHQYPCQSSIEWMRGIEQLIQYSYVVRSRLKYHTFCHSYRHNMPYNWQTLVYLVLWFPWSSQVVPTDLVGFVLWCCNTLSYYHRSIQYTHCFHRRDI